MCAWPSLCRGGKRCSGDLVQTAKKMLRHLYYFTAPCRYYYRALPYDPVRPWKASAVLRYLVTCLERGLACVWACRGCTNAIFWYALHGALTRCSAT